MPDLPVISGDDLVRVLCTFGYSIERTRGSHRQLAAPGRRSLTVPRHRELAPCTLRALVRDAGLTVEEFSALLDP